MKAHVIHIQAGMSLRSLASTMRALGVEVSPVRRTGEMRFRHPAMDRPITVNARKKTASRELLGWSRECVHRISTAAGGGNPRRAA